MKQTFEFYDARAREAATHAEEATLDNVKALNLRAEKTWRLLADQAKQVVIHRAKVLKEREAREAGEASDLR